MTTSDLREAPLIWLDMEMTGLDPETDVVLEIATLVTDGDLQVIAEGPDIIVYQPDDVLDNMSEWCIEQHGKSGLTSACRSSTVHIAEAEHRTIEFLSAYCSPGQSPLCGNTIGQDRRFMVKHTPRLSRFVHYRSVDVSTIKELSLRWYPNLPEYPKAEAHRALDDIRESLGELLHYRENVFRSSARRR